MTNEERRTKDEERRRAGRHEDTKSEPGTGLKPVPVVAFVVSWRAFALFRSRVAVGRGVLKYPNTADRQSANMTADVWVGATIATTLSKELHTMDRMSQLPPSRECAHEEPSAGIVIAFASLE
jgi:hypothetical protein